MIHTCLSIQGPAAAFVIIKTAATVDFKAASREIQKRMSRLFIYLFFLPHRESVVQRSRLVKSMSLVHSQDKVLVALNPSALINRFTAHTHAEIGTLNTQPFTHARRNWYIEHTAFHTHTHKHTQQRLDDNNLNNNTNNSDLCGPVHRADDSQQ